MSDVDGTGVFSSDGLGPIDCRGVCSTCGPFDGRFDSPFEYPFTGGCTCPSMWHGVVPPSCPVHNPGTSVTSDRITLVTGGGSTPIVSDADVDRIARRVVELLKDALR